MDGQAARVSQLLSILVWSLLLAPGWGAAGDWQSMDVTASAYTLARDETKRHHLGTAAWGDQLKRGMKAIAVSRDLIEQGLTHGTEVRIEGLSGTYTVLDKMNKRWQNKIDILMKSKGEAREWGKRQVHIQWRPPSES